MQTENPPTRNKKRDRARVLILAAVALLILVIVVPPFINIGRFRRSILRSIGAGLGRPVYASAVELTLFPRPAFVLHHLTVAAEPEFGAEPVIMAETVTASLRASTLWHRRVEIASLHFDEPSLNLVRNAQGQWNFASLIRNSPILRLPGASSSTKPPPFPYVEATGARINFKLGAEKLPFSLEEANLAFWKESGNEWHVRIRAQPVRTDLVAADTGQIVGEAVVKTSAVLMNAPIQASLEWRKAQLGEISRLLRGEDSGWRGAFDLTASARGTLAKLLLTSNVHIEEFRRAEFVPPSEMDLTAHCQAQIVQDDRRMDSMQCNAPLGDGRLLVQGDFRRPSPSGSSSRGAENVLLPNSGRIDPASVRVALQHVSAGFILELLRHIHPGMAADATASGELNGDADCAWRGVNTLSACTGEFRSTPVTLTLPHLNHSLHVSPLLLTCWPAAIRNLSGRSALPPSRARTRPKPGSAFPAPRRSLWNLAPSRVSLGGPSPATVIGTLTLAGPALNITGTADLAILNRLAHALNIPALSSGIRSIRGNAQMALSLESTWLPEMAADVNANGETASRSHPLEPLAPSYGFVPSQWSGRLQIHQATLQLESFPGTIQIAAAQVNLSPASVEWTGLKATYDHLPFDGSVGWRTSCATSGSVCARHFTLHAARLNAEHLQAALLQSDKDSSVLERINPWAGGIPELPEMSGTFDAGVLSAGTLSLKNASLRIRLQGHSAELLAISGTIFGGSLSGIPAVAPHAAIATRPGGTSRAEYAMDSGAGSAQWGNGPPVYTLRAALRNVHPDLVAAIWDERWGPGTANARIRLQTHGWSAADLARNASGNFALEWRNGTLPGPVAASPISSSSDRKPVIRFERLAAEGTVGDRTLVVTSGHMIPASPQLGLRAFAAASQSLSGTVTFSRLLDLRLQPSGVSITGPLALPAVQARPGKLQASNAGER